MALIPIDGKILNLSVSQAWIKLGTCLTILSFSKSYARWKKKIIFKLKKDLESANKKYTLDLDVLKSNPRGEDKE